MRDRFEYSLKMEAKIISEKSKFYFKMIRDISGKDFIKLKTPPNHL
jgi:hypothetical protein